MNFRSENMQEEEEFDVLAFVIYFWRHKLKLISIILGFIILGIVYAVLTPVEFTSSSTFVPQTSDQAKPGSSLGNLATLAGVTLPSMGGQSEIPSALYPQILSSTTFKKSLLKAPLYLEEWDKPYTYSEYYEQILTDDALTLFKKYTIGLPNTLLSRNNNEVPEVPKENNFPEMISISKRESQHFKRLEGQMKISSNAKEGFITLSFTMPDAHLSAQMTKHAQELLQDELIAFKVSNAREQLVFSEKNYEEKRKEMIAAQNKLAFFRDNNQNVVSAAVQSQIRAYEAEYNFAFNIFTEIAKQLEQAKLQVSKDTPVFTIIQPVTVPYERSAPNRLVIVIMFTFVGVLIAVLYLMYLGAAQYFRLNWKKIDTN